MHFPIIQYISYLHSIFRYYYKHVTYNQTMHKYLISFISGKYIWQKSAYTWINMLTLIELKSSSRTIIIVHNQMGLWLTAFAHVAIVIKLLYLFFLPWWDFIFIFRVAWIGAWCVTICWGLGQWSRTPLVTSPCWCRLRGSSLERYFLDSWRN